MLKFLRRSVPSWSPKAQSLKPEITVRGICFHHFFEPFWPSQLPAYIGILKLVLAPAVCGTRDQAAAWNMGSWRSPKPPGLTSKAPVDPKRISFVTRISRIQLTAQWFSKVFFSCQHPGWLMSKKLTSFIHVQQTHHMRAAPNDFKSLGGFTWCVDSLKLKPVVFSSCVHCKNYNNLCIGTWF